MGDILAGIDDVLTDWHGSRDAMRWQPEPSPEQAARALAALSVTIVPAFNQLKAQIALAFQAMQPLVAALAQHAAEPRQPALNAAYRQRQRNRRKRR